jgi:hypothetical protein
MEVDMRKNIYSRLTTAFVLAVFVLAGCTDGNSPTEPETETSEDTVTSPAPTSSSGTLHIRMIDAPTDEICELHVFIADLRVKPDGEPPLLLGTALGDFDLLALQDGPPAVLGEFPVEQGRYQFIEILLDESRSFVIEKEDPFDEENMNCLETESSLQVPSAKFKVNGGPFDVDEQTTITIDFDARKSLKKKGGNSAAAKGWQLKPVVSITSVEP